MRDGGSVAMVNVSARKGASVLWWLAERHPERKFLAVKGGHSKQDVRDAANVEVLGPVFGPVFGMRDIYRRTRGFAYADPSRDFRSGRASKRKCAESP